MALEISSQYLYTGRGPFDAKSIVKTYADLKNENTWKSEAGNIIAYNGMIVAVWLDKTTPTNNGIYYLYDDAVLVNPTANYIVPAPDVTKDANWHKLGSIDALPELSKQITALQTELDAVKVNVTGLQDSATVVVSTKAELPDTGTVGRIYVVTEEAMTYVWCNNNYLPVGDGGNHDHDEEIQIICGGKAR